MDPKNTTPICQGSGDGRSCQPRDETDKSMCHIWPDLVVRGVGGTAVVRTHQLIKDARPINVLAYSGKCRPGEGAIRVFGAPGPSRLWRW